MSRAVLWQCRRDTDVFEESITYGLNRQRGKRDNCSTDADIVNIVNIVDIVDTIASGSLKTKKMEKLLHVC